jgi:hypothetical protein
MKKTVLTLFASALLTGSVTGVAAGERHHVRAYRTPPPVEESYRAYHAWDRRDSHAWSYPDYGYWESRVEGGAISAPAGH